MSEIKEGVTYRIRIHDFHTLQDGCRTLDLGAEYGTKEAAASAGWAITEAFARIHGLGCENQGDQYMVFYTDGENMGAGALTIEVYDSNGKPVEL